MKIKKFYYAWLLLFLLSLIWGSSPILIKKALISLNPFELGALRLSFAALVLLPFLAKSLRDLKKNDFLILFISGIVGNVIPYFLYPIAQTKKTPNLIPKTFLKVENCLKIIFFSKNRISHILLKKNHYLGAIG